MRHHNVNRKFGRETDQRKALLRSLAVGLIFHGKIATSEAKAKELRAYVEKLVTSCKIGTPAAGRVLTAKIGADCTRLLQKRANDSYKERAGGYTRIIKLGARRGDGSPRAIIEFV